MAADCRFVHCIGDDRDLAGDLIDLAVDGGKVAACRVDQLDALADIADRTVDSADHVADTAMVFVDQVLDLVGGRFRLFCQFTHFFGDYGKAASLLAGPRRFDGGVQRQQIGLPGNRRD